MKLLSIPQFKVKKFFASARQYIISGPLLWIAITQFFIIQAITARAASSYSYTQDSISRLGVTQCTYLRHDYFCSPLHGLINSSFIVLGSATIVCALLFYVRFRNNLMNRMAFVFMGFAGAGAIIVGLYPENISAATHLLGSFLAFSGSAVAILLLAVTLDHTPRTLRSFGILCGLVALIAIAALYTSIVPLKYYGIVERGIDEPEIIWIIIFGTYYTLHDYKRFFETLRIRQKYLAYRLKRVSH